MDTALFGAVFVLGCDMIGRVVIAPYELPIELIVGILGGLIFVVLAALPSPPRPQGDPSHGRRR
ncbi:MAG: iron chelate uptake ABC transporter family permease subunit [Flavonifractor plautii]